MDKVHQQSNFLSMSHFYWLFQHKDIKCQGYQIDYMESNEMDSTIHLQPPILHFTKKWNIFFIKKMKVVDIWISSCDT